MLAIGQFNSDIKNSTFRPGLHFKVPVASETRSKGLGRFFGLGKRLKWCL